jgi:hypothetical protein
MSLTTLFLWKHSCARDFNLYIFMLSAFNFYTPIFSVVLVCPAVNLSLPLYLFGRNEH